MGLKSKIMDFRFCRRGGTPSFLPAIFGMFRNIAAKG